MFSFTSETYLWGVGVLKVSHTLEGWTKDLWIFVTGYDVKLIRCCPEYDAKLIWHPQGKDIVSAAAICAAAVDFLCWSYPTHCASSLRAEPVGCILYNLQL